MINTDWTDPIKVIWILLRYRTTLVKNLDMLPPKKQERYKKVSTVSNTTEMSAMTMTPKDLDGIMKFSDLRDDVKDEVVNYDEEEGKILTESELNDEDALEGGTRMVQVDVHRLTTISEHPEEEGEEDASSTSSRERFYSCASDPRKSIRKSC